MAWANEPLVYTSLTIHFHVFNIGSMKGNSEHKSKGAMPKRVKEPI